MVMLMHARKRTFVLKRPLCPASCPEGGGVFALNASNWAPAAFRAPWSKGLHQTTLAGRHAGHTTGHPLLTGGGVFGSTGLDRDFQEGRGEEGRVPSNHREHPRHERAKAAMFVVCSFSTAAFRKTGK